MRRAVALSLVAFLLVTACAKPSAPLQPKASTPKPSTPPALRQGDDPGNGKSGPVVPELPEAGPLPNGMRRTDLAPGQAITEPGLYFMDVATGRIEGWTMPPFDSTRAMRWMQTTSDQRWITFGMDGRGYLIRRSDGRAFSYNSEHVTLIPGPGVCLVWRQGENHTFALVNADMQLLSTFTVEPGDLQFLFSPDGQKLALARGSGGGGASLVDVATGRVTQLAGTWDDDNVRVVALPALGDFLVIHGQYQKPLWLERYTWQGESVGRKQVDGWDVAVADDGQTLAITQTMGIYGEAVTIEKWDEDQPRLRIAGGLGPEWVAGSRELVVQTSRGWLLVSTTGESLPAPQAGEPRWHPFEWYKPAPGNPDQFLTGTKVVDRLGRTIQSTKIAEGAQARVLSADWGPSAREVQFVVIPPLGKGTDLELWANFLPGVQFPPFPEQYPLQVHEALDGDCLNLRAEPSLKGRVIRCLPAGSRLAMRLKPDGSVSADREEQLLWVAVVTREGDEGWVAINTGRIAYAD